jgi:predicted RNA-binding Zn-ribbon protein involved in translation (DUF1610 family)
MREALARAVNSSDLEVEVYVTDVDRVAALSAASELGSLLLRLREGGQTEFAHRAMLLLSKRVHDKYRLARTISNSVATQAIMEWAYPHCRSCGGAREIMNDKIKITCPTCGGIGVRRYSDGERRQAIGAWGGRIELALYHALAEITHESTGGVGKARDRMGRL